LVLYTSNTSLLIINKQNKTFAGAEFGNVRMLLQVRHDIKDVWSTRFGQ
jgi:hypothetical protein